jgi:hypothetical protein
VTLNRSFIGGEIAQIMYGEGGGGEDDEEEAWEEGGAVVVVNTRGINNTGIVVNTRGMRKKREKLWSGCSQQYRYY